MGPLEVRVLVFGHDYYKFICLIELLSVTCKTIVKLLMCKQISKLHLVYSTIQTLNNKLRHRLSSSGAPLLKGAISNHLLLPGAGPEELHPNILCLMEMEHVIPCHMFLIL
jgi:hypothetical protein